MFSKIRLNALEPAQFAHTVTVFELTWVTGALQLRQFRDVHLRRNTFVVFISNMAFTLLGVHSDHTISKLTASSWFNWKSQVKAFQDSRAVAGAVNFKLIDRFGFSFSQAGPPQIT